MFTRLYADSSGIYDAGYHAQDQYLISIVTILIGILPYRDSNLLLKRMINKRYEVIFSASVNIIRCLFIISLYLQFFKSDA